MTQNALPAVPNVIVIDTCVLISSVLRPLLLRMADGGFFQPVWSTVIGEEWRRTAARLWKVPSDDVAQQWQTMQDGFPHADMGDVSAYQQGLERSDPKDWHVIAAARAAMIRHPDGTIAILTRNVKDFHRAELRRLGLYLFDPDQLMSRWWLRDVQGVKAHLLALRDHIGIDHREPEVLEALLKRERLFRLNRLFHGYA